MDTIVMKGYLDVFVNVLGRVVWAAAGKGLFWYKLILFVVPEVYNALL